MNRHPSQPTTPPLGKHFGKFRISPILRLIPNGCLLTFGVFLATSSAALAVNNDTWTGATSSNWNVGTNWSSTPTSTAPGAAYVSGTGSGNTDIAIFGTQTTGPHTITDSLTGRMIGGITFNGAGTNGSYTVGSSSNTLYLNNAGTITDSGANTSTLASNVDFGGASESITASGGSDLTLSGTLSNNSGAASTLSIGTSSSSTTLVLSGTIQDGTAALTVNRSSSAGIVLLEGANTFSGGYNNGQSGTNNGNITQIGVNSVGSLVGSTASVTSGAFGTGTLILNGGTIMSNGTTARTIYNAVEFRSATNIFGDTTNNGTLTFAGAIVTTLTTTTTLQANSTVNFTNPGAVTGAGDQTLVLTGAANGSIAAILNTATIKTVTMSGTGTWTLSGANTYTGSTSVNQGTLALGGGGSTGGTAITVGSATNLTNATLQISGNYTIGSGGAGTLILTGGNGASTGQGTLSLVDGTTNTLTLADTNAISTVLTIGGTTANTTPSVIDLEVGSSGADEISVSTGKVLLQAGLADINITGLGGLAGGTKTLISGTAATGGSDQTYAQFATFANANLGTSGNLGGYTVSIGSTSTSLTLVESANASPTGSVYWYGAAAGVTGGTTAWNSFENGNTNTSNFSTSATASSATNATGLLGAGSDVIFNATSGVITSAATTTLGQNFTIDSLTFNTAGVSIAAGGAGTNTLTINTSTNSATNGISVTATSGSTDTISAPMILGNAQTWSVNSGDTLAINGAVSGASHALTLGGTGTLALNGTLTDTLAMNNGSNLTGTGTVTSSVTLAGSNTLSSTGTLTTGSIGVNGSGNSISSGNVGGNITINNGGTLTVAGTALGTVGVSSGGILNGTGTTGAATVSGGGAIDLRNSAAGTLSIGGGLTLNTSASLGYDLAALASGSSDQIAITSGTLSIGSALTVNIGELGSSLQAGQEYTLISGFSNNLSLTGTAFTTTGDTGENANYSVVTSGSNYALDVEFSPSAIGAAYYNGQSTNLSAAAAYDTTVSSGTVVSVAPSSVTNLYFAATRNTVNNPALTSTLTVNSVNFYQSATGTQTGFNLGAGSNTDTLTIEAANVNGNTGNTGIIINTGGGSDTISAPVALGASQTWTVTDSTSTLTQSGQVGDGGGGYALTKAGAGVLALPNATGNTYSGGTTVNAGTLLISNSSNSATGSGQVTVNAGATLAGTGTITANATGNNTISITGASTSARANVLVGLASATDTSVGTGLGLNATGGMTLTNANLTFNLSSSSVGTNTQLSVGGTAVTFSSGARSTILSLNLEGNSIIPANSGYVLIAGTGNTIISGGTTSGQFAGLTVALNSQGQEVITGSGTTGVGNLALSLNGLAGNYYANSYLILVDNVNGPSSGDEIEVEVVPEPGTWALMLGGLATLIFWQRRRKQN
jgi:fibronectin-binding autotransporter adhesin